MGGHTIYNPWSVVNFLSRLKIATYWVNTEGAESAVVGNRKLSNDLLIANDMQETVQKLITKFYDSQDGEKIDPVQVLINPEVTLVNLKKDPIAMWTLLAFTGYLSLDNLQETED